MKVTVKEKEEKKAKTLDWKTLPLGTLIKGDYGTQAMVFSDDCQKALLIISSAGNLGHLQKATGFLGHFAEFEIIGKVVDIIAEKE